MVKHGKRKKKKEIRVMSHSTIEIIIKLEVFNSEGSRLCKSSAQSREDNICWFAKEICPNVCISRKFQVWKEILWC